MKNHVFHTRIREDTFNMWLSQEIQYCEKKCGSATKICFVADSCLFCRSKTVGRALLIKRPNVEHLILGRSCGPKY